MSESEELILVHSRSFVAVPALVVMTSPHTKLEAIASVLIGIVRPVLVGWAVASSTAPFDERNPKCELTDFLVEVIPDE